MAKFAWHGRERLGLLRIKDNAIILHAMRWPDEIRSPQSLAPGPVELTEDEIGKALALMDALATDDIPKDVAVDRYTEAISDLITAKQKGKEPSHAAEEEAPAGAVVDLMVQESVQKAKASRGEGATVHELPKKTVAEKAAAKKTAAKKTTAKKANRKSLAKKPQRSA